MKIVAPSVKKDALRLPPAPKLNQLSKEDFEKVSRDGMARLYTPTAAEAAKLEKIFGRIWNMALEVIIRQDGRAIIAGFFVWCQDGSTGSFAAPHDAICCERGDRLIIGIGQSALGESENYIALLIMHELTHALVTVNEKEEHSKSFIEYLNYLIMLYNEQFGTEIENDYTANGEPAANIRKDQARADSVTIPASWRDAIPPVGRNHDHGAAKQKAVNRNGTKRKTAQKSRDNSAEAARRTMICRMQASHATSEKSQGIQKSYNGSFT